MLDNVSTSDSRREGCNDPVEFLYSGLKDKERYAVCLVNRYFEKCNKVYSSAKHNQMFPLDKVFIWTNLYYKKDRLSSVCSGVDSTESLDWFRILCCFLDERHLQQSLDLNKRKKSNSKVKLEPVFIFPDPPSNPEAPQSHPCNVSDPFTLVDTYYTPGLKRKRIVKGLDRKGHSPTDSDSCTETSFCSQSLYGELPIDSVGLHTAPAVRQSMNSTEKKSNPMEICDSQTCYMNNNVQLVSPSTNHQCHFLQDYKNLSLKKQFIVSVLYRWCISILDAVVKQDFGGDSIQKITFGPHVLSCGQLATLYKQVLGSLAWVFDFRFPCGQKTGDTFQDSENVIPLEPLLTIPSYVQQMVRLEAIISECFFSEWCKRHCLANMSRSNDQTTQIGHSMSHDVCTLNKYITEVSESLENVQNRVVWKLEKDILKVQSVNALQDIKTTVDGWRNPKFIASVLEQCTASGVNGKVFSFESLTRSKLEQLDYTNSSTAESITDRWCYNVLSVLEGHSEMRKPNPERLHLILFVLGTVSLVWDILGEFWTRLNLIIQQLTKPSCSDILQEIRLMSQTMVISKAKPGCAWSFTEFPRLFDQLEIFLTHECIPLDISDRALKAWSIVEKAQQAWYRIQKENEDKKKAFEDQENAHRQAALQETEKREQQRRAAVQYVKNGMSRESHYNVSNPFWLIGVPPSLATPALLSKVKRKLSLLLHPDKCLDPQFKADAQLAFTMVTEAFAKAEDMYSKGTHLLCCPPRERPPFGDEVGIPFFSSFSQNPSLKKNYTPQSNFSFSDTPVSNMSKSTPKQPVIKFEMWSASDFNELTDTVRHHNAWNVEFERDSPTGLLEPPHFITHSATKGNIWVSSPEKQGLYMRVFFSRPWQHPTSNDSLMETHRGENGITFLLPGELSQAVNQCTQSNKNPLRSLSAFSCVLFIHTPSLNLSEWIVTHKEMIQPIIESKRKGFSLYIAAQTVDVVHKTVSQAVWATLPPRKFTMPSTKPKVIKLLQLFNNAPDNYKVTEIFREYCELPREQTSTFPLVKEMAGWTYSTLCTVLNALMENAAYNGNKVIF